ncbi:histidine kinase [uncultured Croceitalea sp.]|uniref:sensor histidine kinase n=1 Tax=uncultured Croceitalea sp. TaxID=1798908 RepID=UPI00330672BB
MKKHLGLLLIGFLLGILIYGFINFNLLQSTNEMYLSGLLGVFILYLSVYTNTLLNRLIPFKKLPGLRILIGIFWNALLGFLVSYLAYIIYMKIIGLQVKVAVEFELLAKLAILLCCAALLYNVIYFALYAYHDYAKGQLLQLQLDRKQAELQLNTLKSQLSPHFLFNSINSMAALFQKDIGKAEIFIRSLAKSYQYTLEKHTSSLVSVEEELAFANAYLFLTKTRFGETVHVKMDLDDSIMKLKIPPLTLQLLIENAIKHNSFDIDHPLHVRLTNTGNALTVENNKTTKKSRLASTKIGLKNIKSRYELLTHRKVEVIDAESFIVNVPLL